MYAIMLKLSFVLSISKAVYASVTALPSNVTCKSNQEYCVDTQSCSQEDYKCNGCHKYEHFCPDGTCIKLSVYISQKCTDCGILQYQCPNGKCYGGFFEEEICPSCLDYQITCPDGMCVESGEECTYCDIGFKRCANRDCINVTNDCPKPCFEHQIICQESFTCADNYTLCKCRSPSMIPCEDGRCRTRCNAINEPEHIFESFEFWLVILIPIAPCICVCIAVSRRRKKAKQRRNENMELMPRIVNTPSHFPIPQGTTVPLPQIPVYYEFPDLPPPYESVVTL